MPAVAQMSTPSPQQVTRTSFDRFHTPLRPVFTHGVPSGARHAEAVLVPCENGARMLRENLDTIVWDRPVEDDITSSVALSPDASRFIVASRSGQVDFVQMEQSDEGDSSAKLKRRFRPFENSVIAISKFDASGGLVALAVLEGDVRVFDFDNGFCTHSFRTSHRSPITEVAFHPDPARMLLFVGMEDGSVAEFSMQGKHQHPKKTVNNHVSAVTGFAFVNGGDTVVTVGRDRVMCIAKTANMTDRKLVSCEEIICSVVALQGEGSATVVTTGDRGVMRVWDMATGYEQKSAALPLTIAKSTDLKSAEEDDESNEDSEASITNMSMCGSQKLVIALTDHTLVFISSDETTKQSNVDRYICGNLEEFYDLRTLNKRAECKEEKNVQDFAIASNSSSLWIMRLTTDPRKLQKGEEIKDSISQKKSVDTAEQSEPLHGAWSCNVGLQGHRGIILSVDAITNTNAIDKGDAADSYLATSSRDKTARVWRRNRTSGKWACMAIAEGHTDAVGAVALSPKTAAGQFFIVTGAADRTIKLWNLDAARKKVNKRAASGGEAHSVSLSAAWTLLAHEKDVNAIAISPDAQCIATGSQDRSLKIWSVKGSLQTTCVGHRRGIWSVSFSTVDRVVASCSGDATIRIWSVQNGTCLRTFQGHMSGVLKALFISNGTQIASSGADGLIKVWSTKSGECHTTIEAHEDRVWALDVLNDGDCLISGGADGRAFTWKDTTAERALEAVKEREREAAIGQVVSDATRARNWNVAVRGALEIRMPSKLRSIFADMILSTQDVDRELVDLMKSLVETGWESIEQLFLACRDWNATGGSRNAAIASRVLQALFTAFGPDRLCDELNRDVRALVEALIAHCQRHHDRVSALGGRVALLEHTLDSMRALGTIEVAVEDAKTNRKKRKAENRGEVKFNKKARDMVY